METIGLNSTGAAVEDVQRRLIKLGYYLGENPTDGIYGKLTANAVRDFRQIKGLIDGDEIDAIVWAALVDATFELGDRTLYLRMPYFHGNDVAQLQHALGILGFACGPEDGIFGAYTEKAVRDFQLNMGIEPDGIVGIATFDAIERLRWAYRDKNPVDPNQVTSSFARAAEVLEANHICVYGVNFATRQIAARIANLAIATTNSSKLVSADSLSGVPSAQTILVEIRSDNYRNNYQGPESAPVVVFETPNELNTRLKLAISSLKSSPKRVVVKISPLFDISEQQLVQECDLIDSHLIQSQRNEIQHYAILILDAICYAFDK